MSIADWSFETSYKYGPGELVVTASTFKDGDVWAFEVTDEVMPDAHWAQYPADVVKKAHDLRAGCL